MKVLIAVNEAVARQTLAEAMSAGGHETVTVHDGPSALSALERPEGPKLAMVARDLPGLGGLEVCRRARTALAAPPYILLVAAADEPGATEAALDGGADDVLTPPFQGGEIRARVRIGQRVVELQDLLHKNQEALRFKVMNDSLTGAPNRGAIMETLGRELDRGKRERLPVAVALADLDHFKDVNDTHGHLAGDAVLREAVMRMRGSLRPYDGLGRYGGEEFLLVLPGCGDAQAYGLGERLRTRLAAEPIAVSEARIRVTMSVGIVTTRGDEARGPEDLMRAADEALYRAKDRGRNRVELADPAPGA